MNLINFFRIKEENNNQIQKNEKDTQELKLKMNKDDKGRIVKVYQRSRRHWITKYSRIGPFGPRSGRS